MRQRCGYRLLRTVAVVLVAAATIASAQDDESKCCCTTYDVSVCVNAIRKKVDIELNETYSQSLEQARTFYTAQDIQRLRIAERRWIAYRDATCDAEYRLWEGGTGGPSARSYCEIGVTRQRIADLKKAYLH
jgi:uncharacterized protein YecT (DUF1311 family)